MKSLFSLNRRNIFIWIGSLLLLLIVILGFADPFAIVMSYFFESIILGILHFFKMLLAAKSHSSNAAKRGMYKPLFFLVHYSFFILVQSIFVFAMFGMSDPHIKEPFHLISNYSYALQIEGLNWGLGILTSVLILETYFFYIRPQLYKHLSQEDIFFKPYIRVFIQQFTVLIAMFFVMLTGLGIIVAATLTLVRLFVDLSGVYISSSKENLLKAARYMKKDGIQTDERAIKELKKYL